MWDMIFSTSLTPLVGPTQSLRFGCLMHLLLISFTDSKKGKVTRKRANHLSAVQMLEQKNERKADLKERELKLKSEELQLQKKKFEQEAAERNERLKLELEERRMFLQILKEKM